MSEYHLIPFIWDKTERGKTSLVAPLKLILIIAQALVNHDTLPIFGAV